MNINITKLSTVCALECWIGTQGRNVGTGRAVGEQGLRKVKTKALLFVGTKETKGCC